MQEFPGQEKWREQSYEVENLGSANHVERRVSTEVLAGKK